MRTSEPLSPESGIDFGSNPVRSPFPPRCRCSRPPSPVWDLQASAGQPAPQPDGRRYFSRDLCRRLTWIVAQWRPGSLNSKCVADRATQQPKGEDRLT